jgi:hypothetical protein
MTCNTSIPRAALKCHQCNETVQGDTSSDTHPDEELRKIYFTWQKSDYNVIWLIKASLSWKALPIEMNKQQFKMPTVDWKLLKTGSNPLWSPKMTVHLVFGIFFISKCLQTWHFNYTLQKRDCLESEHSNYVKYMARKKQITLWALITRWDLENDLIKNYGVFFGISGSSSGLVCGQVHQGIIILQLYW